MPKRLTDHSADLCERPRRRLNSTFDFSIQMPLPINKRELLNSLQAAYSKLVEEAAGIPSGLERDPGVEGGISPCDLIAYQIGWGRLLLSWDDIETQGEIAEMPAPGFKWNQLGLLADSFYEEQHDQTLEQLLGKFGALVGQIRLHIESNSEETLFGVGKRHWAGQKWPLAKWIQVNTVAPYESARTKLRKWKKSNPSFQGAAGKLRLPMPCALRAPAAPELKR